MLETIKKWFGIGQAPVEKPKSVVQKPSIMGLTAGTSFKVDTLAIQLLLDHLVISGVAETQVIQAAGIVDMDGNTLLRFYTDDEAWLQIVCQGAPAPENIIDVKLFHYYDTKSVSEHEWNAVLREDVAMADFELEGNHYTPVWQGASGGSAKPVHLKELCYDKESDEPDETAQFAMLYERELPTGNGEHEFLFVSAEEKFVNGRADRCLVWSSGVNLTPSQLMI